MRCLRRLLLITIVCTTWSLLGSAALLHPNKQIPSGWIPQSTPPPPSSPFVFSLTTVMPEPDYLSAFVADRSDPASPHWLQWHTYESLEPHIRPLPYAVLAIERWLGSEAGVVWEAYGPFYSVSTTVAAAERLFNTTLLGCQHQLTGTILVRQNSATYVPDSVHAIIDAAHGIDKADVAVASRRVVTSVASSPTTAAVHHSFHPMLWNGALTGHDISLWYSYPDPLLQPASPASSAQLWPTSVGVLQTHDNENYWLPGLTQYGLDVGYTNANLSSVVAGIELLDSQAVNDPQSANDSSVESQVDMEAVAAVTTRTRLYAMKCSAEYCESSTAAAANLVLAMQYANPLPQVISYSYGKAEFPSQINQESAIQTLTALGVTLIASIGDSGYGSSGTPEWPASSAYVLSVGGTTMAVSGGVVVGESAWEGSAGGVSVYTLRPSYQNYFTTNVTNTHRTCPDVAALADNFYCYLGGNSSTAAGSCSGQCLCGGTSIAAPMWAGVIALLNSVTLTYCNTTLGFVNPLLYTMADNCSGCFHDITTGSSNGHNATVGYDLLTGLGTPNVAAMQAWLTERFNDSATGCPPQPAHLPPLASSSSSFSSRTSSSSPSSSVSDCSSSSSSSSSSAPSQSSSPLSSASSSSLASSTTTRVSSSASSPLPFVASSSSSLSSPSVPSTGGSLVTSARSASSSTGSSGVVAANKAAAVHGRRSVLLWCLIGAAIAAVTSL